MSDHHLQGPTWTDQDEELRRMWQVGESPERIAELLSRTVAAVMTRAARLGLPRRFAPGRKPRQVRTVSSAVTTPAIPATPRVDTSKMVNDKNRVLRVCLMCRSKFMSLGPHNRLCPKCKESPDYDAGSRLPDLGFSF